LLQRAALRHMGPLEALDARLFLAINRLPQPRWSATLDAAVGLPFLGGGSWVLGVLGGCLLRVPGSRSALVELLPTVIGATLAVEYPVRAFCRRHRPFVHLVRGMVVGKKPSSRSLPSGHTASSLACAWLLCSRWPSRARVFLALASGIGFSRIYTGAHYPSEVVCGALLAAPLAELIRRAVRRALSWTAASRNGSGEAPPAARRRSPHRRA
jgi:membrane-associated phospholipid phosphatase